MAEMPKCATADSEDSPTNQKSAGQSPKTRNSDPWWKNSGRTGKTSLRNSQVTMMSFREELQAAQGSL